VIIYSSQTPIYLGVTGTRQTSPSLEALIDEYFAHVASRLLHNDSTIVHGCCVGVDAVVGRTAKAYGYRVLAVVPHDRSRVDPAWETYSDSALVMQTGTTYADRNAMLVDNIDALSAWPLEHSRTKSSLRSGTWQTIRMAERRGLPTDIRVLTPEVMHVSRTAAWSLAVRLGEGLPHGV
jgi:hypothetical protein